MRRTSNITLLAMVVAALALALPLSGCSPSDPAALASEEGFLVGNLAPGFGLQNLAGQAVSLSQFRGRPVLLNFWASWCGPCRDEMPLLQAIYDDKTLAGKGLVMLGIDLGESPATVKQFMESNGYTFPALLDTQQIVAGQYNIRSIPTTYFIDKDGIIKDIKIGAFANKSQIVMALNKIVP